MTDQSKDLLGLAPYGEALKIAVQGAVDGASAFLGRICLPAAEELGLLFQDRMRVWRASNAANIATKAEALLSASGNDTAVHAHPRVVGAIIEHGSWTDTDEVQSMWSGLLASACTADGQDEENLLFVSILQQLSSSEARLLNYSCLNAPKTCTRAGLIWSDDYDVPAQELFAVSGLTDIHRLDRELDHLRVLGMIQGGFDPNNPSLIVDLTPTALALNMYVRCQGSRSAPSEYFGVHPEKPSGTA